MKDNDFKISSTFQSRLNDLVNETPYKKSELPKRIGIAKDILIKALNIGLLPSTKSLVVIADFFNVSLDYLLGLTDDDYFEKALQAKTFQQRLDELKRLKKVTYCKIATELGFSRSLFNTWKKYNYIPSLEIAFSLSDYFDVSLDYLLGRTDVRN